MAQINPSEGVTVTGFSEDVPFQRGFVLPPEDVELCRGLAKEAELYGQSAVRLDRGERVAAGKVDQFVGQVGELVLCQLVRGWEGGREEYRRAREAHRANVWAGDDGSDMLSIANVNAKASRWNKRSWLEHHLWVRDAEYHGEQMVYVLILVYEPARDHPVQNVRVIVPGWARLNHVSWEELPFGGGEPRFQVRAEFLEVGRSPERVWLVER